jgi:hypothetical protein
VAKCSCDAISSDTIVVLRIAAGNLPNTSPLVVFQASQKWRKSSRDNAYPLSLSLGLLRVFCTSISYHKNAEHIFSVSLLLGFIATSASIPHRQDCGGCSPSLDRGNGCVEASQWEGEGGDSQSHEALPGHLLLLPSRPLSLVSSLSRRIILSVIFFVVCFFQVERLRL